MKERPLGETCTALEEENRQGEKAKRRYSSSCMQQAWSCKELEGRWLTLQSWFKQGWGGCDLYSRRLSHWLGLDQGQRGRTSAKGLVPVSLYMFRWGISTLIFWRRRTHLFGAMQARTARVWGWSSELCRGPQWAERRCSGMEDMHHRERGVSEGSPKRD